MSKIFSFKDLEVWQESMDFTKTIYQITQGFPQEEIYGLTRQLRRATASIPMNIAEGKGRHSTKEFLHFLFIARGSLYETITCIELGNKLDYINANTKDSLIQTTEKILAKLNGLIKSIKNRC